MNDPDNFFTKLAPILGALVSLKWFKGTRWEKLFMFAGGAVLSFYASPYVAIRAGLPEGFTGFGLGLFGMAICARGYEVIQIFPIKEVLNKIIKWCGL